MSNKILTPEQIDKFKTAPWMASGLPVIEIFDSHEAIRADLAEETRLKDKFHNALCCANETNKRRSGFLQRAEKAEAELAASQAECARVKQRLAYLGERHVFFSWIGDLITVYNDGVPYTACSLDDALDLVPALSSPKGPR